MCSFYESKKIFSFLSLDFLLLAATIHKVRKYKMNSYIVR